MEKNKRFPFHERDLRYKRFDIKEKPNSNAAIICIMDTSGSMDTEKKFLARSFYFLLYEFIKLKYDKSELVFIAHTTEAQEVNEDDFFRKGESGGTCISSGLLRALEIISERYSPSLWNNYVFLMSDGDNFEPDNAATVKAMQELTEVCNLVGYGEIKPSGSGYWSGSSMIEEFNAVKSEKFKSLLIKGKEDIYKRLQEFLGKDEVK